MLRCINNFLKHNTEKSFKFLAKSPSKYLKENDKKFLAEYVFTSKANNQKYETGMYAGNWLNLPFGFVESILDHLIEFSKELCALLYNEDYAVTSWNYDDFFVEKAKEEMQKQLI